jgi:hypothetical protein
MRDRILLGFALGAALLVVTPTLPASAETPENRASFKQIDRQAIGKGPVGWDAYRNPFALAELRPGAQARQFSSFDRAGGNDDGFVGTYSCLRMSDVGCVIAERGGPGQIDSMWFTRDNGSMARNGRILIELDGRPVVDALLQDVVDGKLGAPFVWPLVGNGDDTAGGSVIKVPMPYTQSMRVTVQANPLFYHVSYQEFADANGVYTFNPNDQALDVIERLRAFGMRDPKATPPGARTQGAQGDLAPGERRTFVPVAGPGWINQLRLKVPQVIPSPRVGDDGRAFAVGGSSRFRVAIDPANQGVRLIRRYDPQIGHQRARVLVDGVEVGVWDSGNPVPPGGWGVQAIDVPAWLTAGKSVLGVSNEFISSDLDVNEFRYDVHSKVGEDWRRTDVMDLGLGHPGSEKSHGYAITGLSWQGYRVYRYGFDPNDVARSDAVLADARLRISFDGRTTVDAPLGEFFGSALGEYDTLSMMSSVDGAAEGWYNTWWPMPFGESAQVEVFNGSGVPMTGVTVEVTSAPDSGLPEKLRTGTHGYFNATHRSGATVEGRDWTFLETAGSGVYYGVTHGMRGLITTGNRRNYLEGDERVYVDGANSPTLYGTGTEDFYESGWYFRDGITYVMPLAGNPSYELDGDGCQFDCTGTYRLMAADGVAFNSSLRFDIQHGPVNDMPANYSSTSYWYGQPRQSLVQSDLLDVADPASRAAHGYQAGGETTARLNSTFEGKDERVPVDRGLAWATGPIEFTVATGADNKGVRLLRMGDQQQAYQHVAVSVDGQPAGQWLQPLGNHHSRWLEDTFELPPNLTQGKASVKVQLTPVQGAPAWSAAQYRVLAKVNPR